MGEMQRLSPPNKTAVQTIDICSDGTRILIGQDSDGGRTANLTLWSLDSLTLQSELSRSDAELILMARFSPSGESVAYVDSSLQPRILDLHSGSVAVLEVEDSAVQWLSFARHRGRLVLSGDKVEVWDAGMREIVWKAPDQPSLGRGEELFTAVADLSPDGSTVAICRPGEEAVRLYDIDSGELMMILHDAPPAARWLNFDPKGNYLAIIERRSHGIFLWDLRTRARHLAWRFDASTEAYWCLRFHPDGRHLGLGMLSGYVELVELEGGQTVWDQRIHAGRVWDVAFTADGSGMASGGDDGSVYLLDSRVR